MKRRSLETRFWKDSYIQSLSANGKLLFNYLLLNEYVNIIHTYELPNNYISLETGLSLKEIQNLKVKFHTDGKFLFKDNWIKIVNADKYEHYEGETNEKAKQNLIKIIPSHIIQYFDTPQREESIPPEGVLITNNQKPIIKYNKIEDLKEEDFEEIANKYNTTIDFVKFQYDKMVTWAESKPNNPKLKGRNWKMTLMTFVREDALKIKQEYGKQASDVSV